MMGPLTVLLLIAIFFAITAFVKTVRIVPQKQAFIIERLGKYTATLEAGLHILIPFIDKVTYRHSLKEQAVDVESQTCITKDNISVEVDGILYLQVLDPVKASYGINNYTFAVSQLAQTTMRSIIGTMMLDKTFEERDKINSEIVQAIDKAADPWGIKVTRYEVKNIIPPQSIKDAMEKQMRAEREKRALIAESEGDRQAKINRAEGDRDAVIAQANGKAAEIEAIAVATANGLRKVAEAIQAQGGAEAVSLRVAEQYIQRFGELAKTNTTMIVPTNVADIAGVVATAMTVIKKTVNLSEIKKSKDN